MNVQKVGMMILMWEKINQKFKKYPARIRVAEKMIELGLSLNDDGKIYCGNLKISDKALATAADVDRRVIKSTISIIREDEELFNLFNNIIGVVNAGCVNKINFCITKKESVFNAVSSCSSNISNNGSFVI